MLKKMYILVCQISLLSPSKRWLHTWGRNPCKVRRFLSLATRFTHISGGILSRSSLRFLGCLLETQTFSSLQIVYGMKIWRLGRSLQDLNVLLLEPLLCCHVGRGVRYGKNITIIIILCRVGFNILSEQYSQTNFPIIKTKPLKR